MTFNQAYKYAMARSYIFRRFDYEVKEAQKNGTDIGCMIFCTEPGETFYYGFDGVDLHKGKHTRRRASVILNRGEALIIL